MLTRKDIARIEVIAKLTQGSITTIEAAEALGLSQRQVLRLKKKVRESGSEAVVHQNRGKTPHNAISSELSTHIIDIYKSDDFSGCNFNHFRELLSEYYSINIGYASLHKILSSAGFSSPKKRRRFKPHRRRKRRPQAGLLLQVDATPFRWFKGDLRMYALHGAIDDATGQIVALYMTKNECLFGYFQMLKRTLLNFGIPVSIYADRHTIFRSPNKDKAIINPNINAFDTQFGRTLNELGIELIPARSPQAKGRIERLWQTLQSRLPVEFALNDIHTMDEANDFLAKYIYAYNSSFAIEPRDSDTMFTRIDNDMDLDDILCVKETRNVDAGGVFSFHGKSFKVIETMDTGIIPTGAKVTVLARYDGCIKVSFRNIIFEAVRFIPLKRKAVAVEPKTPKSKAHAVPDDHYYKNCFGKTYFDSSLSDSEVLAMLSDLFLRKV